MAPMISSSSFITVYPFAKILSKHHDVKIIGPTFGKPPYIMDKDLNFEFIEPWIRHPVQVGIINLFFKNLKRLRKGDHDLVHSFKLLPHTSYAAYKAKKKTGKPLVISIDDYDVASPRNPLKKWVLSIAEKSYKHADAVTVSSRFLQKIYGGEIVYQVANEYVFTKKKYTGNMVRKKYDLEDKLVIIYAGTFYKTKGVDILIKAVQGLDRKDVKLLLLGEGSERYKKIAGTETIFIGRVPIEQVPEYVAAADIYAIPTLDTLYTRAEIPAKIFEAMVLGKAVVASRLSDIPIILDYGRCGILTRPNNVDSLKNGILKFIENPRLRKQMGLKARKRYWKEYSYKQIEKKIIRLYSRFE
jgi:glycosyltransferase involved in cell wall biosynthesis